MTASCTSGGINLQQNINVFNPDFPKKSIGPYDALCQNEREFFDKIIKVQIDRQTYKQTD